MARWGYVVTAAKNKLTHGKVAYGAHIQHMGVLRGDTLYKEIASCLATNPVLAENLVKGIGGFIKEKLQQGYKLDFGAFKVGLSLRGGFDSKNDSFDPKRNKVRVTMSPSVGLTKAVAELRPENLTATIDPIIKSVCTLDGALPKSVIACHQPCGMNGASFPRAGFKGDDDGVWLETKDGDRAATATIITVTSTRIDFQIDADVPPGRYNLYIGAHPVHDTGIATDFIPVKVVR